MPSLSRLVPGIAPPAVSGDKFLAWARQVHYSFSENSGSGRKWIICFLLAPLFLLGIIINNSLFPAAVQQ
jgi:hypothetical protein